MLGKLSVPGHPTSLDDSSARVYCACNRCGWGLLGHFSLIYLFSFLSSDALYLHSCVNARVVINVDGQIDKHMNGRKIGSLH